MGKFVFAVVAAVASLVLGKKSCVYSKITGTLYLNDNIYIYMY